MAQSVSTAYEGLKTKKYEGEIRQEPEDWIQAIAVNEPKPTTIKFAPHRLEAMREKYGKLIIIPRIKDAKHANDRKPRKIPKEAKSKP